MKTKTYNQVPRTDAGVLFIESFFIENLGRGPVISALLPLSLASPSLELPASAVFCGWVVPVPFDDSARVEGTFDPTPTSSPDAEVRSILASGLKKQNTNKKRQVDGKLCKKVLDYNKNSFLHVAGNPRRAPMLPRN